MKEAGFTYLPPTPGQVSRGLEQAKQPGRVAYDAYRARAVFPNFVKQAVDSLVGVLHHKPPVIELPDKMEPMRTTATNKGESLALLLRRINENQLITGRYGLLLDAPDNAPAGALPYIATYAARAIINWDDGRRDELTKQNLNLVILEESEAERQTNFEWDHTSKFRVLILGDPKTNEPQGAAVFRVGVFRDAQQSFNEEALITPSLAGRTLDKIPFVFVNTSDIVPEPDTPPLLGLSNLALTVYRGEADYRQALFMQGQDTLVVMGGTEESYEIGAGAHLNVPVEGGAKFIGVNSKGLSEMRTALENDRQEAADIGGRLLDNRNGVEASGTALNIRVSTRTASVKQVALTGAAALELILKTGAEWLGADPDEVSVTPNLDFIDDLLTGQNLLEYIQAKLLGAPYSLESLHALMQRKGLTEMEFDEEMARIEAEAPAPEGTDAGGDPDEE